MTTVVGIRESGKIHIGSDTKWSREDESGLTSKKFIKYGEGYFGFAGHVGVIHITKFMLYGENSSYNALSFINTPNLTLQTKEELRNEVSTFFEGLRVIASAVNSEERSISFFYLDNKKALKGVFNTNEGLVELQIELFEDAESPYAIAIGSGGKYAYNYIANEISGCESRVLVRDAIDYAISRDEASGGKVVVEEKRPMLLN